MAINGLNPYATLGNAGTSAVKPTESSGATSKTEGVKNPVAEGVSTFREAVQTAEKTAIDTAVSGADPHALVQALANAEMMLDTAVTVRDKVVEAYQELLRMPV